MAFKKRYILAQEAEERIVSLFRKERNDAADIFNTAIDACQSIILDMYDNAPDVVERKVGEWIDDEMVCKARCSACDTEWSWISNEMDRFNFCPNCGARMFDKDNNVPNKGESDG